MTCSTSNKNYLVSVGQAMAFDTTCAGEQLVFVADTLMNSTISQAIQSSQVYGGTGSRLLFEFDYQKEIKVSLEDAAFSPTYLAIQNGTKLAKKLGEVYRNETVTFDTSGTVTLKGVPTGNVQVGQEDGTYLLALATGGVLTVPSMANKEAVVVYTENLNTKTLTIDSTSFPKSMKLVLSIDIFDSNKVKVEEMQIIIPKFKVDGNFEMSLTHDGVATSSLNGKAMDACGKYADIKFIPVEGTTNECTVTDLIVTPNPIGLDSSINGDKVQLVVRPKFSDGSLGTPLANTAVTYTSSDDDDVTVDTNGLVTLVNGTSIDKVVITVSQAVGAVSTKVPVVIH